MPEPKRVKNRVHWDVDGLDRRAAGAPGATLLRARDDEIGWDVLADVEGNEFCVFAPSRGRDDEVSSVTSEARVTPGQDP